MPHLPTFSDVTDLSVIAHRIGLHAEAARAEAQRLETAVADAAWHGTAASAFDLLAHDVITALRLAAGRLDDAAAALRRHLAAVEHELALLAHLGADGLRLGGQVLRGLRDELVHPTTLLGDGAEVLSSAGHVLGDAASLVGIG